MSKIYPIKSVQTIKKAQTVMKSSVNKTIKSQDQSKPILDFSLEELGFYQFGDKLIKMKFPR